MDKDLFGICPYVTAQKLLSGKWTILIMYELSEEERRFNELQRLLPNLTSATLSKQLRMMEENGLIIRTVYDQIPPKVVYSLSDLGEKFKPVLAAVEDWGKEYIHYLKKRQNESD